MTILDRLAARGITEILHFTTQRGIVGTLAQHMLLSRRRLPDADYLSHVLHFNASARAEAAQGIDKSHDWLDYINLSISEINRRYFEFSRGWHPNSDIWWGILAFVPEIVNHEGVIFATTNNIYEHCSRQAGLEGFDALFESTIRRKSSWQASRLGREARLTTCEQAEVLYPRQLSTDYLRRIYVEDGHHYDQLRSCLLEFDVEGVDVVVSPAKFLGRKN